MSTPKADELAQKWDAGLLMPSDLLAAARDLERENVDHGLTIATIQDIVTNDKMSNKAKVLAIGYVLRKEAQP